MTKGQGFGFGLGKMKELAAAFQKAQEVQQKAQTLQAELETMEIKGESADGSVIVTVSGNQEPRSIEITQAAYDQGAEKLSELVQEAMLAAYRESTTTMRERMEDITSGLNLPM